MDPQTPTEGTHLNRHAHKNYTQSSTGLNAEISKSLQKFHPITSSQIILFGIAQFVGYSNRKSLYPYASYFAQHYSMTNFQFSFILSGFDIGGILAVFASQSRWLRHVTINYCVMILCFCLTIANIFTSIDYGNTTMEYYILLLLRIISGLITCLMWCQVNGTTAIYCKNGKERTRALMTVEFSWTASTLFFFLIGLVIFRFGIEIFWYLMAFVSLIGCITSYFVPNLSIYQASIATIYTRQIDRNINNNCNYIPKYRYGGDGENYTYARNGDLQSASDFPIQIILVHVETPQN